MHGRADSYGVVGDGRQHVSLDAEQACQCARHGIVDHFWHRGNPARVHLFSTPTRSATCEHNQQPLFPTGASEQMGHQVTKDGTSIRCQSLLREPSAGVEHIPL